MGICLKYELNIVVFHSDFLNRIRLRRTDSLSLKGEGSPFCVPVAQSLWVWQSILVITGWLTTLVNCWCLHFAVSSRVTINRSWTENFLLWKTCGFILIYTRTPFKNNILNQILQFWQPPAQTWVCWYLTACLMVIFPLSKDKVPGRGWKSH